VRCCVKGCCTVGWWVATLHSARQGEVVCVSWSQFDTVTECGIIVIRGAWTADAVCRCEWTAKSFGVSSAGATADRARVVEGEDGRESDGQQNWSDVWSTRRIWRARLAACTERWLWSLRTTNHRPGCHSSVITHRYHTPVVADAVDIVIICFCDCMCVLVSVP